MSYALFVGVGSVVFLVALVVPQVVAHLAKDMVVLLVITIGILAEEVALVVF